MSSPAQQPIGVALAGGASSRMGRDKALLRLAGETLVEHAVGRLRAVCSEVVVADRGRQLLSGAQSLADGPGAGPVAGILGAAAARPGRDLLVLACDLPRVPVALLRRLARAAAEGEGLVPRWRRGVEPLCALYRPAAAARFARRVREGEMALHRLLAEGMLFLEEDELVRFGPPGRLFLNLNRPEDLKTL